MLFIFLSEALAAKNLSTVSDKIKDRLEQLDQFDDDNMQEMANLSQQDYIKRIDELNEALQQAWNDDDRVKSLKIVIQALI
jgi:predicted ribonuclease toxin of YeeF-YezG toxin-antitoxin module